MHKLFLAISVMFVFMSCTKNALRTSNQSQDFLMLTSITGDSADFSFIYENGQVTDVMARVDDGYYQPNLPYSPYAHLSYDSANYIKATSTDPYSGYAYTEYFLNENKLPLKIIIHFNNYDAKDVVDFFYNPQTNLLDSVHDTNDGVYFSRAYMHYDGSDITTITFSTPYSHDTICSQTDYTYDKTQPNIFNAIDPLWYIYEAPFATYNAQNSWVQASFPLLVRLFSQNTFIHVHDVASTYWEQSYNFNYTLNSSGKLETIWYDNQPNWVLHFNYGN